VKLETFQHKMGIGWSLDAFPSLDSEQTLLLVFASPEYLKDDEAILQLREAYPNSHIVGCSSSGEIFGNKVSDRSLSVAAAKFEKGTVATAVTEVSEISDSLAAGATLAKQLHRDDLRGVFVLSDGLHVNGSELVKGLNSVLPEGVTVTGGLAGDGDRFQETWIIQNGEPRTGVICAIGLYGEHLHIGHGSKGGWDRFGPERSITRSSGSVLYELDGKPALELYRKYLGDRATGLPATGLLFPLSIRADSTDERRLVRTILAIDDDEQSMTFAGDVPTGWKAQLMSANFDRLVGGASDAATMIGVSNPHAATLAIAISCVGRRLVLGERTEEEVEATLDILPTGAKQVGFYSYGEISPFASGACDLHNQTMTLTTISEAA